MGRHIPRRKGRGCPGAISQDAGLFLDMYWVSLAYHSCSQGLWNSTIAGPMPSLMDFSIRVAFSSADFCGNRQKYQNSVLQVVYRPAFLDDMRRGRRRYFSEAFRVSMFAWSARSSPLGNVRDLFKTEDLADERPSKLVEKARALLSVELNHPGVTTIQALMVLSVVYGSHGDDSTAWGLSGMAIRLLFDLGLHRDPTELGKIETLTQLDLDARRLVFWGCFTFDRSVQSLCYLPPANDLCAHLIKTCAMYLGRPCAIKLEDVTTKRPVAHANSNDEELLMCNEYANLFQVIGRIGRAM